MSFEHFAHFSKNGGRMSKDYVDIRQQTINEIHRPDFSATWQLLTAWGYQVHTKITAARIRSLP